MSARRSNEAAADKRRLILDAAIRVFAREGFHHCRVSDIAREANVAYGLKVRGVRDVQRKVDCVLEQVGLRVTLLEESFQEARRRSTLAEAKALEAEAPARLEAPLVRVGKGDTFRGAGRNAP